MADIYWILSKIDLLAIADILLVGLVIYGILVMVWGTQAVQLLRGVILLALVISLVGSLVPLTAFNWLLASSGQALLVVVAIVLQPELRRALDRLGRAGGLSLWAAREYNIEHLVREIVSACEHLSRLRHGALIVIERATGLQDHIDTGVRLDSAVVEELLETLFFPKTPLHDGAVIIREDRIVAAACVLPLAETINTESHLGTRHRAAVGITEQTDAIVVVVSEETGVISMARNGRIVRHLDERRLTALLQSLLKPKARRPGRARGEPGGEKNGASADERPATDN